MSAPTGSNAQKISDALDHVSQIVAACRKRCEELVRSVEVRTIRTVGIVGAGVMGAAIAREHAARGYSVVLCDTDPEALRKAESARSTGFSRNDAQILAATESRSADIRYTHSLADLAGCDLILESISEKRPAKQSLYNQLAPLLAKGTLLATNTSAIPITRLASGLPAPDRFCGMHFCHPVRLRPLVELIPGARDGRRNPRLDCSPRFIARENAVRGPRRAGLRCKSSAHGVPQLGARYVD